MLLNKHLGLSHGKIATLLQEWFGLRVRPSAVTHALQRAARQAATTYAALREQVPGSPAVSPDETSWKVSGHLQWLWAFATPTAVLYAIQPGRRGFPQAAAVLGTDHAGVLVRDGWAPYRRFTHAAHQSCLTHLVRRYRELTVDYPQAAWLRQVRQGATARLARPRPPRRRSALDTRHRSRARALFDQLAGLLDAPVRLPGLQRFAAHLAVELPAVFGFLFDPTIDATNWRAEKALRPAAVNRTVSGGNRSQRGAEAQQILASVVHTARLRRLDTREVLVELLHARQPIASPVLAVD